MATYTVRYGAGSIADGTYRYERAVIVTDDTHAHCVEHYDVWIASEGVLLRKLVSWGEPVTVEEGWA